MLTSWRLSQFKSAMDETDLKLAPLTLFTGANSAGKSTVIQSMLLTAQTIQSSVMSRPVVLNGHIARLGSFTDIVSSGDEKKSITVGFDLVPDIESATVFGGDGQVWRENLYVRHGSEVLRVSVSYSFSITPGPNETIDRELLQLQPLLTASNIKVDYEDEDKISSASVKIERSNDSVESRILELKLSDASMQGLLADSLKYTVQSSPEADGGRLDGLSVKSKDVGVYLYHFLPRSIASRFDEVAALVAIQLRLLTEPGSHRGYPANRSMLRAPDPVIKYLKEVLTPVLEETEGDQVMGSLTRRRMKESLTLFEDSGDLVTLSRSLRGFPSKDIHIINELILKNRHAIEALLKNDRLPKYNLEMKLPNEHVRYGVDYVNNFFSRSVRYLGPLRDEPKPVYPLAGANDPSDVGFRGEHTAAVLDVHKNTVIHYVSSKQFSSDGATLTPSKATLFTAVQDWLEYMGVGTDFHTSDLGKLGHELKIVTTGSGLQHDLTQVGVGVSQVLPILVLALLAEGGSTLIFEQPELHLHPKVQSRLADFFVSMTKLRKQCVVETHSEYLINRLRFRAAADEGSDVADSAIIYFVEKELNKSVYRQVTIDDLGNLDSWPKGFFDESEFATAAILRQSMKKRSRKRNS
ncbi:AAA family ATPase [Rhodanobacter ginsenosidimutans]|uniref:DUF3696 domain-containing protein n=1 Tax=Rhodanobacter ginsenosidimutans TaxID=490571 RepID=A0ABW0JVH3_9GAMM